MKELGFDIEYYLWVGMFAPKNTPANVITYLRDAINKAAHGDQYKTALTNLGLELAYMDQRGVREILGDDTTRIEDAVRQIGRVEG